MSIPRARQGCQSFRHLKQDQSGAAAIEFALILPVFLLILFGIMQFGYLFVVQNSMANAAREGARAMAIQQAAPEDSIALVENALSLWGADFNVEADTQPDPSGRNEVSITVSLPLSQIAFGDYLGVFAGRSIQTVASMRQD